MDMRDFILRKQVAILLAHSLLREEAAPPFVIFQALISPKCHTHVISGMQTMFRSANGDRRNKGPDQFLCDAFAHIDIATNLSIVHFLRSFYPSHGAQPCAGIAFPSLNKR